MNARILSDVYYVNGAPIPASYFSALDTAQMQAMNGDHWGIYSPSSLITIGGEGMWACAAYTPNQSGFIFTCAPAIQNVLYSGTRITHGDSDWIELESGHSAASRELRTSLGPALDASFATPEEPSNGQPGTNYSNLSHGSRVIGVSSGYLGGGRLIMPLRVHDQATVDVVDVNWFCGNAHGGGLPAHFPKARVLRIDMLGNAVPLCTVTTTIGWLGNGWVAISNASNTTAYYSGGAIQGGIYPADPGTVIDTSQYSYVVEIEDESGTGAEPGNIFVEAVAILIDIPDLRPQ